MRRLILPRILALWLSLCLALPSPAFSLRQQAQPETSGLEELKEAITNPESSGLEEVRLAEKARSWTDESGVPLGEIYDVVTTSGEVAGRVVVLNPRGVEPWFVWNPAIEEEGFPHWQQPSETFVPETWNKLKTSGLPFEAWRAQLNDPDPQRRPASLPEHLKKAELVGLANGAQPNYYTPWGFQIHPGRRVIRQRYTLEQYPLNGDFWVFIARPGVPRVAAFRFKDNQLLGEVVDARIEGGEPRGSKVRPVNTETLAVGGVPGILEGRNVSGQIRYWGDVGSRIDLKPNMVTWNPNIPASFSFIGSTNDGAVFHGAISAHLTMGQVTELVRGRPGLGARQMLVMGGSADVNQELLGETGRVMGTAGEGSARPGQKGGERNLNEAVPLYRRSPSDGAAALDGMLKSYEQLTQAVQDGSLLRWIPEWEGVSGQLPFAETGQDPAGRHDFTVDEHILAVVQQADTHFPEICPRVDPVRYRRVALLHDIGKVGYEAVTGDHAYRSEALARVILTRLGYPQEVVDSDAQIVLYHNALDWLIRHPAFPPYLDLEAFVKFLTPETLDILLALKLSDLAGKRQRWDPEEFSTEQQRYEKAVDILREILISENNVAAAIWRELFQPAKFGFPSPAGSGLEEGTVREFLRRAREALGKNDPELALEALKKESFFGAIAALAVAASPGPNRWTERELALLAYVILPTFDTEMQGFELARKWVAEDFEGDIAARAPVPLPDVNALENAMSFVQTSVTSQAIPESLLDLAEQGFLPESINLVYLGMRALEVLVEATSARTTVQEQLRLWGDATASTLIYWQRKYHYEPVAPDLIERFGTIPNPEDSFIWDLLDAQPGVFREKRWFFQMPRGIVREYVSLDGLLIAQSNGLDFVLGLVEDDATTVRVRESYDGDRMVRVVDIKWGKLEKEFQQKPGRDPKEPVVVGIRYDRSQSKLTLVLNSSIVTPDEIKRAHKVLRPIPVKTQTPDGKKRSAFLALALETGLPPDWVVEGDLEDSDDDEEGEEWKKGSGLEETTKEIFDRWVELLNGEEFQEKELRKQGWKLAHRGEEALDLLEGLLSGETLTYKEMGVLFLRKVVLWTAKLNPSNISLLRRALEITQKMDPSDTAEIQNLLVTAENLEAARQSPWPAPHRVFEPPKEKAGWVKWVTWHSFSQRFANQVSAALDQLKAQGLDNPVESIEDIAFVVGTKETARDVFIYVQGEEGVFQAIKNQVAGKVPGINFTVAWLPSAADLNEPAIIFQQEIKVGARSRVELGREGLNPKTAIITLKGDLRQMQEFIGKISPESIAAVAFNGFILTKKQLPITDLKVYRVTFDDDEGNRVIAFFV